MKSGKQGKNVVGGVNDKARGEARAKMLADIEALPAGGELPAADAEGSAKGSTVPGGAGPPVPSGLAQHDGKPNVAASGQAGGLRVRRPPCPVPLSSRWVLSCAGSAWSSRLLISRRPQ